MSKIFGGRTESKNYFEIVQAGYNEGLEREEIQIHCGENGNLMIVKTDEGYVVDAFDCVWEEDINPDEICLENDCD